jgi:thioredoxin
MAPRRGLPAVDHEGAQQVFRRRRRAPDAAESSRAAAEPIAAPQAGARVQPIDDASFLQLTEGGYMIVDFWAPWCAPCRSFAPVFASVAQAHHGEVRFGQCNVDANPSTAQLLGLRSIPTLVVFGPDGSEIGRSTGAVSRGDLEVTVGQLATRAAGGVEEGRSGG